MNEHSRYEGVYTRRGRLVGEWATTNPGHSGTVLCCPHQACQEVRDRAVREAFRVAAALAQTPDRCWLPRPC